MWWQSPICGKPFAYYILCGLVLKWKFYCRFLFTKFTSMTKFTTSPTFLILLDDAIANLYKIKTSQWVCHFSCWGLVYVFVSFVVITVTDNHCLVCFGEVSGAHKCITCRHPVHIICGRPVGEEGYGQKVKCDKCCDRGKYMPLISLSLASI